jgi:metal-responsive CopG/Arc/MetJ family transcriptional regulator
MRNILVSLPEELIVELDEGAKEGFMSRTEYIRQVLLKEVGGKYPELIREIDRNDITRFADLDDS